MLTVSSFLCIYRAVLPGELPGQGVGQQAGLTQRLPPWGDRIMMYELRLIVDGAIELSHLTTQ